MKIKAINHRTANSAEYLAGIPGEWLREEISVDDHYTLSEEEIQKGYVLITPKEAKAIEQTYSADFKTWLSTIEQTKKQAVSAIRQEGISLRNDLVTIKNTSSNPAIVKLAEVLLFMIKYTNLDIVE